MGFTHYWNTAGCLDNHRGLTDALPVLRDIAERHADLLCLEFDQPDEPPLLTPEEIRLNGKGEDGHETFLFRTRPADADWAFARQMRSTASAIRRMAHGAFCKTARKPYDLPVCEMLLVLQACLPGLSVDSDGFAAHLDDPVLDGSWMEAIDNVKRYGIDCRIEVIRRRPPYCDLEPVLSGCPVLPATTA